LTKELEYAIFVLGQGNSREGTKPMSTTTDQQVKVIRMAIKTLDYEKRKVIMKPADDNQVEVLQDIDNEIQALEDAIIALRNADKFRNSLKSFLGE
jgi:6-phosphogluconate dehydrogenase (decarboxylating)